MMTPKDEIDDIWKLIAKRNKLTLINIAGIALILTCQFILVKFLPEEYLEYMVFYPLLILVWGSMMVTLIIKVNLQIYKMNQELIARIRERQYVREHSQEIHPGNQP